MSDDLVEMEVERASRVIAVVPVLGGGHGGSSGAQGGSSGAQERVGGATALTWVLRRLARCKGVAKIAVVHEAGEDVSGWEAGQVVAGDAGLRGRVVWVPVVSLTDGTHESRLAARRWSPTSWRGGLGGATCYDEILTARAAVMAMEQLDATAALLVGANWPLVDAAMCDAVIERHVSNPGRLKLVFTQAPPGLCGCVVARELMMELRDHGASIGALLDYQPRLPQGDPIGKDPCVQIEPGVRNAVVRAVMDGRGGRWSRVVREVVEMEQGAMEAGVVEVAGRMLKAAERGLEEGGPGVVTVELTTRRRAVGEIVPQRYVEDEAMRRGPMDLGMAERVMEQIAKWGDAAVMLGGLGDALEHPQWEQIVAAAHRAGVRGVGISTDLLVDEAVLERIVASGAEVVSVNLPADCEQTYRHLMGVDGYATVRRNIEWLLTARREAMVSASAGSSEVGAAAGRGVVMTMGTGRAGLPWVVPRFTKTAGNVEELETFFDRWSYWASGAVIDSPTTGLGLMPDLAVMDMAGPRRRACRQLSRRMTVLADGRVALCDQDWLGRWAAGRIGESGEAGKAGGSGDDLAAAWRRLVQRWREQGAGVVGAPCDGCREWHRA